MSKSGREGGLSFGNFRNCICFCHFNRKAGIFRGLWLSLSSLIRLTNAAQSLRGEVPRSAKKPKKWRKTVARSSPGNDFYWRQL